MAEHLAGSETAFVTTMNTRAKELGMNDTHFVNCTGLDDGEEAKEIMDRELASEGRSMTSVDNRKRPQVHG